MNPQITNIKRYAKELKLLYMSQNIEIQAQDARDPLLFMQEMLLYANQFDIVKAKNNDN